MKKPSKRSSLLLVGGGILVAAGVVAFQHARRRRRRLLQRRTQLRSLCKLLPKAELHAHLHGCARLATIAELAPPTVAVDTSALLVERGDDRSLSACFAIFGAIHQTVTSVAAVRRITREVLDDFADDNVRYLELRSTPRELRDADAEGYVRSVLGVIAERERDAAAGMCPPLTVRMLLSVDRTGGLEKAVETVALAVRLREEVASSGGARLIVGVDFSGNPTKDCFETYVPAFEAARAAGLKISAHTAEVEDKADTDSILRFRPDRLGHALFLDAEHMAQLRASPIPVELCPTSNLMTLKLSRASDHPTMADFLGAAYPVSISTDDSSVFATTPSAELAIAAEECDLSARQVAKLAAAPLDHAFESDQAVMRALREEMAAETERVLAAFGVIDA